MMKPKKLSLFLILSNVVLLLACILLLVLLFRPGASDSFQPVSTPVSDSALVGQMRTTKFYAESGMFDTTDNARFRLEFVEIVPGGCTDEGEEGYDLVRIKRTVKRETSGGPDDNFGCSVIARRTATGTRSTIPITLSGVSHIRWE